MPGYTPPVVFAAAGFAVGLASGALELGEKLYRWVSPVIEMPEVHMQYWLLGPYFFEQGPGYTSGYEEYFKQQPNIQVFESSLYDYRHALLADFGSAYADAFEEAFNDPDSFPDFPLVDTDSLRRLYQHVRSEVAQKPDSDLHLEPGVMYTLVLENVSDVPIESVTLFGYELDVGPTPVEFSYPTVADFSDIRRDGSCLAAEEYGAWSCLLPEDVVVREMEKTASGLRRGDKLLIPLYSELIASESTSGGPQTHSLAIGRVRIITGFSINSGDHSFPVEAVRPVFNTLKLDPTFDIRSGA
jgi:hypothetical protein